MRIGLNLDNNNTKESTRISAAPANYSKAELFNVKENNIKYKKLYDEYISSANINIESCIIIKYYDITKKYHEEYYSVEKNKTEHYIDINKGKHKFNSIKNIKDKLIITPKQEQE